MSEHLWRAEAHRFGPGKIHAIKHDTLDMDGYVWDGSSTYCGRILRDLPGENMGASSISDVTCRSCVKSYESALRWAEVSAENERRQRRYEEERARQDREWWAWYNRYLQTPEWRERRRRVMARANGICEGCGEREATQVHHLTYTRVGHEMLFDLVAVCDACHRTIHQDKRAA